MKQVKFQTQMIGLDPGTVQSAYVVWNGERILEKGILPNSDMLLKCQEFNRISSSYHLAYEFMQSYGMAVGKEVFETVFWIGRFVQSCISLKPIRVYRKDIKLYFCNSMKAKDTNIRAALIDRFGPPGVKKEPGLLYGVKKDEWSALAIAVYAWDTMEGT